MPKHIRSQTVHLLTPNKTTSVQNMCLSSYFMHPSHSTLVCHLLTRLCLAANHILNSNFFKQKN